MDPEIAKQLEQEFEVLIRTSGSLARAQMGLAEGFAKTAKELGVDVGNLGKQTNAAAGQLNGLGGAADRNRKSFDDNSAAVAANAEMMRSLKLAGGRAVDAVMSLGKTMLDSKGSFGAYGDAVNKAGSAAADLASEFGIVGKILGLFIKAGTKVIEYQLKQADSVVKNLDALGKMGAAGAITGDQLVKFGHKAGYTSLQLEKLTKPIESIKTGLVVLGGNAQEGAKEFLKMAAVGQQTRESFRRLGVSQEELTQHQADYVALQAKSGRAISQEMRDKGGLQKASLEYTKNLVELSAITGKSVEEAKKELEATQSTYTRALANAALGAEEAKLRKVMNSEADADQKAKAKARLDEIESIKKNRDQVDKALSSVPLNEAQKAAYQEFIETGRRSKEFNETFGQLNINFEAQREKFLKGQMTEGEFREQLKTGILDRVEQVGDSARMAGEDFGKQVGLGAEMVKFASANSAQDLAEGAKDAKGKIADAAAGKGEVGEDPVQKARNTMVENEIKAATAADALAWSTNAIAKGYFPELGNTVEKLTQMLEKAIEFIQKFWKEISIAVGVLMGISVMGKLRTAAKALGGAGGIGKTVLKGAKGFLGKAALPVAGAIAAYDAYKGFQADKDAPMTQRLKNAGSSALSGVTFGLLGTSADDIAAKKAAGTAPTTVGAAKPATATTAATPAQDKVEVPVDDKKAHDWAWSVYIGANTPEQVPKSLVKRVNEILKDPPDRWTPESVKKAQEKLKSTATPATATAKTDPIAAAKAMMGGPTATTGPTVPADLNSKLGGEGADKALKDNTAALNSLNVSITKTTSLGLGKGTDSLSKDLSETFKKTGLKTAEDMKKEISSISQSQKDQVSKMADAMLKDGSLGGSIDLKPKDMMAEIAKMSDDYKKTGLKTSQDMLKTHKEELAKIGEGIIPKDLGMDFGGGMPKMASMPMPMTGSMAGRQGPSVEQMMAMGMSPRQMFELRKAMMLQKHQGMGSQSGMPSMGAPGMMMAGGGATMPGSGTVFRPPMPSGGGGGGGGGIGGFLSGLFGSLMDTGKEVYGALMGEDPEGKIGGGGGDIKKADSGQAAKGPRKSTKGIVVHHTGGRGMQVAMDTLKARGLGYHYLVDRDGTVVNYVDDGQIAHHAGKTDKKPEIGNKNSVGISLVAKDDTDLTAAQIKAAFGLGKGLMSKYGATVVSGHGESSSHKHPEEGKTVAEAIRSGKLPDKMPQAKDGGILSGKKSGFPAMLHGNEIVVPLDPNSLLAELGKKSATQVSKEIQEKSEKLTGTNPEMFKEISGMNTQIMEMLSNKLDMMINKIENGNNTQSKILQYTRA